MDSGFNPERPPFVNAASIRDQTDLIEGLAAFPSAEIDRAVFDVFQQSAQVRVVSRSGRLAMDDLMLACVERLAGKGYDQELKPRLSSRIREMEVTVLENEELEKSAVRNCLEQLWAAYKRGDPKAIADLYHPNANLVLQGQEVAVGQPAIEREYTKLLAFDPFALIPMSSKR